jgi:hypothetical protein
MADTKPEEEAKKIEITITTPEKLNKSKSPEPKETPKEIRAWFAGLSAIERATVLGFTDGPMVETLLRLASSSSSVFPSIRVQENRTTDVPISRGEWYSFYLGLQDPHATLNSFCEKIPAHVCVFVDVMRFRFFSSCLTFLVFLALLGNRRYRMGSFGCLEQCESNLGKGRGNL